MRRFFSARWAGQVPLRRLFWRDAAVVATAVNVAFGIAALLVLAVGGPLWAALALYALPLPYTLFLTAAIWRTAARQSQGLEALAYQWGAILWLIVATLL